MTGPAAAVTRMIHPDIPLDHPIGGWCPAQRLDMLESMWLEIGIVVLSIVCFALLDLYVLGCEKV